MRRVQMRVLRFGDLGILIFECDGGTELICGKDRRLEVRLLRCLILRR